MPGIGMDCAGPVVCAYREHGGPIYDEPNYKRIPRWAQLNRVATHNFGQAMPPDQAMPGDVMALQFPEFREPCHMGVVVPGGVVTIEDGGRVEVQTMNQTKHRSVCCWGVR